MKATYVLALALMAAPLAAQRPHQEIREARRQPPVPACTERGVLCLLDSTRAVTSECCMSSAVAEWLVFPTLDDSLEFFSTVVRGTEATTLVTLGVRGLRQFWQEHLPGVTAPFLRQRMPIRGTYTLAVDLDMLEPRVGVPYELRIRAARTAHEYMIAPARLVLRDTTARYRVVSARSGGNPRAALVPAGTYRLLGSPGDTLLVCKLPCRSVQRVPIASAAGTLTF